MNKHINFEDTIFILNARIRMIRDLLRLNTDTDLFLRQTVGDLEFISFVLDMLTDKFLANTKFLDREAEAENLSDAEWQFSQVLNEFSRNSCPFPPERFPEIPGLISGLREKSAKRRKLIDDSYIPAGQAEMEPVVSQAEMNGLLGSA